MFLNSPPELELITRISDQGRMLASTVCLICKLQVGASKKCC